MEDQIFIQVKFTKELKDGNTFTDALVYPLEDWDALSDKQLEKDKAERVEAHETMLEASEAAEIETPPEES